MMCHVICDCVLQATSCRAVSYRLMPCRVPSCIVVSCSVLPCHVVQCRVVHCLVMTCHDVGFELVVPCDVVLCRVESLHCVDTLFANFRRITRSSDLSQDSPSCVRGPATHRHVQLQDVLGESVLVACWQPSEQPRQQKKRIPKSAHGVNHVREERGHLRAAHR